jgi:hypothetical protein
VSDCPDDLYYARLESGALYLAERAPDRVSRSEHLKMARIYRRRARDAAEPALAIGTIH